MTQGYQADAAELTAIALALQAPMSDIDRMALQADLGAQAPAVTPPVVQPPQAQQPVQTPQPQAPVVDTQVQQQPAPVVPPEEVPNKVRTRTNGDPVTATALTIFNDRATAGNPVSLGEAERLAKSVLGIADVSAAPVVPPVTQVPQAQQPTQAPAPVPPTTSPDVAAIEAEMATLAGDLVQALNPLSDRFDQGEAAKLLQRQSALATQKARAEMQAQAQQVTQERYMADWQNSMAQAVEQFPAIADASGPLSLLAGAMQEAALSNPQHPDHALAKQGVSALHFTQAAAKALSIAPKGQPTSPVAAQQPVTTTSTPHVPTLSNSAPPLAALLGGGSSPPSTASPTANVLDMLMNGNNAALWNQATYQFTGVGQ